MRATFFLDTSAWYAALSQRDQHHASAANRYREALAARTLMVTTNLVVAEMQVLIMRDAGAAASLRFLDQLYDDVLHEVVWSTRDLERRALDRWLRTYRDHQFSLADAVSFEIMRDRGIRTALATDHHFSVAGYERVP